MLKDFKHIALAGPHRDYFVITEPVELAFSGKNHSSKRYLAGTKLARLFEKDGAFHDGIVFGSAAYGGATEHSDIDILGVTERKRPFRTDLVVKNPGTGEAIRATVFGYPRESKFLEVGLRETLDLKHVSRPVGFTSLSFSRLWSANTSTLVLASADATDLVRRALHGIYSRGLRQATPQMVMEEILEMERIVSPTHKELKGRLTRGLRETLLTNVEQTMALLPFVKPQEARQYTRPRNITRLKTNPHQPYQIGEGIRDLTVDPFPNKVDQQRAEEFQFRRAKIKPLIAQHLKPLLEHR